jgi:uncharacterized protein DUF4062
MSFKTRNLRVFLSSSMAEFSIQRTAIKQELDSLGIPNFVFEKEGASDQAPGEMFPSAVRAASVYIGVFGKICGQYTREEYELARAHKIACHLYVQRINDGERSEELKKFLQSLSGVSDVPTINYFQATDELVTQIKRDLWGWRDPLVGHGDGERDQLDIKANLPILCDRDPQEIQFERQVAAYFQVRSIRPLLLILPGPVEERHGLYLDRVKLCSLEEYLTKAGVRGGKKVIQIRKSPCAMTSPAHFRSEILSLLQEQETQDDKGIVEYVRKKRLNALVIVVRLLASECANHPQIPLQYISEYLAVFPDTLEKVLISVVVCLEEDRGSRKSQAWWKRWVNSMGSAHGGKGPFDKAMSEIQQQYQDGSKLRVEILPRLVSPKVGDIRRWLDHELVKSTVPFVAEPEIKAIFQDRDSLPMDDLYLKLTALLTKRPG